MLDMKIVGDATDIPNAVGTGAALLFRSYHPRHGATIEAPRKSKAPFERRRYRGPLRGRFGGPSYNRGVNKLKAVVDRLVRETGLSRTVSRRIAQKINRLAGKVSWATPLREARATGVSTSVDANRKAPVPVKPPPGGRMILPKIPASKPVVKRPAASQRFRPR